MISPKIIFGFKNFFSVLNFILTLRALRQNFNTAWKIIFWNHRNRGIWIFEITEINFNFLFSNPRDLRVETGFSCDETFWSPTSRSRNFLRKCLPLVVSSSFSKSVESKIRQRSNFSTPIQYYCIGVQNLHASAHPTSWHIPKKFTSRINFLLR